MKNKPDIIILTMSRWDGVYSSAVLSLAKELSKSGRVFYIDHPFTLKDVIREYKTPAIKSRKAALLRGKNAFRTPAGFPEGFVAVTPGIMLPINKLSGGTLYNTLSKINDHILFRRLRQLKREYDIGEFVFFNSFNPFYAHRFPKDIRPMVNIYQSRDDITQESYIARHGQRLEIEAIQNADIATATGKTLVKRLSDASGEKVMHLPNAANVKLFAKAMSGELPLPLELKNINNKIILYMGNISNLRIDFELLHKVALAHSDKTLLLIGEQRYRYEPLERLDNVYFIGPRALEELPAYLQYADCAIIPFLRNRLTQSIYPLKINEYLAAGKPVVSTLFSEDMREFEQVAHLTNNTGEFITAISTAIAADTPQHRAKRNEAAQANSWENRAELFWRLVSNHLNHKSNVTEYVEPFEA